MSMFTNPPARIPETPFHRVNDRFSGSREVQDYIAGLWTAFGPASDDGTVQEIEVHALVPNSWAYGDPAQLPAIPVYCVFVDSTDIEAALTIAHRLATV